MFITKFAFYKQQHKYKIILMMMKWVLIVVELFFVLNLDLPCIIIGNVSPLLLLDVVEYKSIIFYSDQPRHYTNNRVYLDEINQDKLMLHVNN
jgi:hypothetical protein